MGITPQLSIGIPTYNRALHLDILLRHLSRQINDAVEILVVDNCSTDNTPEVVAAHQAGLPGLGYRRNPENIGLNGSYAVLLDQMRAPWCTIIGDDEIVCPGYLDRLLEAIRRDDADILLCGIQKYTATGLLGQPIPLFFQPPDPSLSCQDDAGLAAYFDSVRNLAGVFSFLSNVVFRRREISATVVAPALLQGNFPHAYRMLHALYSGARIRYLADNIIYTIKGNDSKDFTDLIQRALLDLDGYAALAEALFSHRPVAGQAFMRVVCRETMGYVAPNIAMALLQRACSKKTSWEKFMDSLARSYPREDWPGPLRLVSRIPEALWFFAHAMAVAVSPLLAWRYRARTAPRAFADSVWLNPEKEAAPPWNQTADLFSE